jgi:hypothetical protein
VRVVSSCGHGLQCKNELMTAIRRVDLGLRRIPPRERSRVSMSVEKLCASLPKDDDARS